MKRLSLLLLLLISLGLILKPTAHAQTMEHEPVVIDILAEINSFRMEHGIQPLTFNPLLEQMAKEQAEFIAEQNFQPPEWDFHRDRLGQHALQRAVRWEWRNYGDNPHLIAVGENAALGSVQYAMNYWLNSNLHLTAMENPSYREVGIHAIQHEYGFLFIVVFGARPNELPILLHPQTCELYIPDEHFHRHSPGMWLHEAIDIQLMDANGNPLTELMPWQPTLPLPANATNPLIIQYRDHHEIIQNEVDLRTHLVINKDTKNLTADTCLARVPEVEFDENLEVVVDISEHEFVIETSATPHHDERMGLMDELIVSPNGHNYAEEATANAEESINPEAALISGTPLPVHMPQNTVAEVATPVPIAQPATNPQTTNSLFVTPQPPATTQNNGTAITTPQPTPSPQNEVALVATPQPATNAQTTNTVFSNNTNTQPQTQSQNVIVEVADSVNDYVWSKTPLTGLPANVDNLNAFAHLHCREYPSTAARSLGQINNRTAITVLGVASERDNQQGYKDAMFINIPDIFTTPTNAENIWLAINWEIGEPLPFRCWVNAQFVDIAFDGRSQNASDVLVPLVHAETLAQIPYNIPGGYTPLGTVQHEQQESTAPVIQAQPLVPNTNPPAANTTPNTPQPITTTGISALVDVNPEITVPLWETTSLSSHVLIHLPNGTSLSVLRLDEENDMVMVTYELNGASTSGWIATKYLVIVKDGEVLSLPRLSDLLAQ